MLKEKQIPKIITDFVFDLRYFSVRCGDRSTIYLDTNTGSVDFNEGKYGLNAYKLYPREIGGFHVKDHKLILKFRNKNWEKGVSYYLGTIDNAIIREKAKNFCSKSNTIINLKKKKI